MSEEGRISTKRRSYRGKTSRGKGRTWVEVSGGHGHSRDAGRFILRRLLLKTKSELNRPLTSRSTLVKVGTSTIRVVHKVVPRYCWLWPKPSLSITFPSFLRYTCDDESSVLLSVIFPYLSVLCYVPLVLSPTVRTQWTTKSSPSFCYTYGVHRPSWWFISKSDTFYSSPLLVDSNWPKKEPLLVHSLTSNGLHH